MNLDNLRQTIIYPDQYDMLTEDYLNSKMYSRSDYSDILLDIQRNGQQEPILIRNYSIVDGWKRVKALQKLRLPIIAKVLAGMSEAKVDEIYDNLHNVEYTPIKDRSAGIMYAIVAENASNKNKKLGSIFKVSATTIKMAKAIYRYNKDLAVALSNGNKLLIRSASGEVVTTSAISTIYKAVLAGDTLAISINKADRKGVVYFITDGTYTKIGVSNNVNHRLSILQVANPLELSIVKTIESNTPYKLEAELHEKYKEYSIRGEWFKLDLSTVL